MGDPRIQNSSGLLLTVRKILGTVAEEHPELFHYTDIKGLVGIIQSQSLWATHYAFKNDSEEVRFFLKKQLPRLLKEVAQEYLTKRIQNDLNVLSEIEFRGGKERIIDHFIEETLNAYKKILFSHQSGNEPLAEPYIFSFCTIKNACEDVSRHGLLSQWRGYGRDGGGYAIVFDTARLSELLDKVGRKWQNGGDIFMGDVVYSFPDNSKFHLEFGKDLDVIQKFHFCKLNNNLDPNVEAKYFSALMRCACRYKHWGFEEENEVRIVVIPNGKQISELAREGGVAVHDIPLKHCSDTAVSYIELFEEITTIPTMPLPIKRIIVGPGINSHEKDKKVLKVKKLIEQHGMQVGVFASEIPYIG